MRFHNFCKTGCASHFFLDARAGDKGAASCPSFNEMDIKPHQFVSYVANENIEELVNSKSLWKCLSCFACVERCPRDVKPGKLIDAARQLVVRQKGQNYLTPDEIPELLDPELPQQLLVSAFRRYRRQPWCRE